MINLNKICEKFMWQVELNDNVLVNEFNETPDGEVKRTPFDVVNRNENFNSISLVSNLESLKNTKIKLNKDGLFEVMNKTYKFEILDADTKENIFKNKLKNSLMMYRQDMQNMNGGMSFRYSYSIGYKEDDGNLFSRIAFKTSVEGVSFKITLTSSITDRNVILRIISNEGETSTPIELKANKKIDINIV